jgi:hypothetical protein
MWFAGMKNGLKKLQLHLYHLQLDRFKIEFCTKFNHHNTNRFQLSG